MLRIYVALDRETAVMAHVANERKNASESLMGRTDRAKTGLSKGIANRSFDFTDTVPVIISEAGLYMLIMRPKSPHATALPRFVCSELIPSITKAGMYTTKETATECYGLMGAKDETLSPWSFVDDHVAASK